MYQQNSTCTVNFHRINHKKTQNVNVNDGIKIKNIFIPSVRTTNYGLKQLKVNGPRIWNTLPTNIPECFLEET